MPRGSASVHTQDLPVCKHLIAQPEPGLRLHTDRPSRQMIRPLGAGAVTGTGKEGVSVSKKLSQVLEESGIPLDYQAGGMPPEMPPEEMPPEEIPPDLAAAMGGGAMPPDAMGAPPMGAMGGSLPPEALAGAQAPMIPGAGGMPVAASGDEGMSKVSATSISALAAKLRK